jgi:hypothetical protein
MSPCLRSPHLSAIALLVFVFGGTHAEAGPVSTIVFDGVGSGEALHVNYKGSDLYVDVGQFDMHLVDSNGNRGAEFYSFCVDLDHYMRSTYTVNQRSTADGLNQGGAVSYLYQTYGETSLDAQHAAALQLAIWDEVSDGGDGLAAGSFQFSGDANLISLVNSYELSARSHTATGFWLDASPSGTAQNRGQSVLFPGVPTIVPQQDPPTSGVPEPSTLVLFGLGGAAFAGHRRWRKQRRCVVPQKPK